MLDIKFIRENPLKVADALRKRNITVDFAPLLKLDEERRASILETEKLQNRRNKAAEDFGKLKKLGQNPPEALAAEMNDIREVIKVNEKKMGELDLQIEEFLLGIPNIPDENVTVGTTAEDNKVVRQVGEVPKFDFEPKAHWEIGEKLNMLDFDAAAKLSGARFALLRGNGCLLERALIGFMLDTHREKGYVEIMAPYLVNRESMRGTGQLPKFEDELFRVPDDGLYLIPTAEVSVTNIHRGDMLDEKQLPIKYVSYSACFRREAGSYGKDTKGLIRNHQFNKVELVKFVNPEDSMAELEKLTSDAEEILKKLGITYRVLELCTGDLGFSSSKTYDLEVWMPGEKRWREISSCSNFKDFQARRMNIKFKRENKSKDFVHTLNGSGLAIGRTFAAILENYQNKDGSLNIPEVLKPYMKTDMLAG